MALYLNSLAAADQAIMLGASNGSLLVNNAYYLYIDIARALACTFCFQYPQSFFHILVS